MGPSANAGKNVSPARMTVTPKSSPPKSGVSVGKVPADGATAVLADGPARDREDRDDEEEPTDEDRQSERRVHPLRVRGDPRERRAVVVPGRRERVEHLGEAVRPRVPDRHVQHRRRDDGDPRAHEHRHGHHQGVDHHELHVGGHDLLAQVLGRAPDHQAGDEHRHQHEDQDPVQADADAAGAHLTELDVDQGHHPAERREAVVHRVHRAVRRPGRPGAPHRRDGRAEPDLLALEVAAGLRGRRRPGRPSDDRASGCRSSRTRRPASW